MLCSPDRPTESISRCQSDSPIVRRSDSSVRLHGRAGAYQVAIAERRIDPAYRRPDLVLARGSSRETGALARIGTLPVVGEQVGQRVWRMLEQVVIGVGFCGLELANFLTIRYQRVDEPIELGLHLA